MLKSLEIVNNRLYWLKKNKATGLLIEEPALERIKQDLEILQLTIKWKNMIHFKPDPEFLNDEEYNIMVSELKLIENYIKHHFGGYLPECFRKVGDNL